MIQWIETQKGKEPFTLAQVIRHEPKGPNEPTGKFFKIFPYEQKFNMDLEPLLYHVGKKTFYRLLGQDRLVWINTECRGSSKYELTSEKNKKVILSELGNVVGFKGEIIVSQRVTKTMSPEQQRSYDEWAKKNSLKPKTTYYQDNVWIDAEIPIKFINTDSNEEIPKVGEYIKKYDANGLRVRNIIPIEDIDIPVNEKDKTELKSLKVEINSEFSKKAAKFSTEEWDNYRKSWIEKTKELL